MNIQIIQASHEISRFLDSSSYSMIEIVLRKQLEGNVYADYFGGALGGFDDIWCSILQYPITVYLPWAMLLI